MVAQNTFGDCVVGAYPTLHSHVSVQEPWEVDKYAVCTRAFTQAARVPLRVINAVRPQWARDIVLENPTAPLPAKKLCKDYFNRREEAAVKLLKRPSSGNSQDNQT
jgi:hypothetical protein